MKTITIFRRWFNGQVVALFPLEATEHPAYSQAYECGTPCQLDPCLVVALTDPATPDQYASLARELEGLGYDLDIRSRVPANAYAKRKAALSIVPA